MNPPQRREQPAEPSQRPVLQPLRTNDTRTIQVGMGLWAAALVVLVIVQPGADHRWWIWTCVAGLAGGVFGLWYVRRRDRHAPEDPPDDAPSTAG
ncbi:DUF2530 domain-containing protein [Spongiactinospora sp. TRM90649]|uniref:DUF2530 domain-containing protein n=1 Tax=Spongiactinospora sp. TRM90649 TaxID=3031114 RepID=UPI0023F6CC62|nr:DUF2530 domain-containing protein [Spongiactinospora sp. TRM90649]MDF5757811.1 DUF2530 domain-containing protein [Spongiactinospora sp. TRM90649]